MRKQFEWKRSGGRGLKLSVGMWRESSPLPLFSFAIVHLRDEVPTRRFSISNPPLSGLRPSTWQIQDDSTRDGLQGRAYLFLRLRIRSMRRAPAGTHPVARPDPDPAGTDEH